MQLLPEGRQSGGVTHKKKYKTNLKEIQP